MTDQGKNLPQAFIDGQFKKGQSGNPAGKPKGCRSMMSILKELLLMEIKCQNPITEKVETMEIKVAIGIKLIEKALKEGDLGAIKEIRDMVDGPIRQGLLIEDKTIPSKSELLDRLNALKKRGK